MIVFWGLYWGALILRNYHMGLQGSLRGCAEIVCIYIYIRPNMASVQVLELV